MTDLLAIDRGLVVAPAGCGKTHLIADAISRYSGAKPLLVLTHTNSGVAALRGRLERIGAKRGAYRLSTIDGWAVRLVSTFPLRSGYAVTDVTRPDYPEIRSRAWKLLKAGHISDVIAASYGRLLVDEYQDCSVNQHGIIYRLAELLPTCVVGDPLQSIFGFGPDALASWQEHVCQHFPLVAELDKPWRWVNAGTEAFGQWLLDVRRRLLAGENIDLAHAPDNVTWVRLKGDADDHAVALKAGRTKAVNQDGSVLIIGESRSPQSQQRFASLTPGAVTVEAVDLRDLVTFAAGLDLTAADALPRVAAFAERLMTNVGAAQLLERVRILTGGTARKAATPVESAALSFLEGKSCPTLVELLVELNKQTGTHVYRPAVLRACIRSLQISAAENISFADATVRVREQNRATGRTLPRRAVGSTLLLKGLEAEVAVILDGDGLNAKNLYVAMTRGSHRLVVCSKASTLAPHNMQA